MVVGKAAKTLISMTSYFCSLIQLMTAVLVSSCVSVGVFPPDRLYRRQQSIPSCGLV